jgi:hypothetical protein
MIAMPRMPAKPFLTRCLPAALAVALWIALGGAAPAGAQGAPPHPELTRQIEALLAEKRTRTPAQRKLSSRLVYESRMRRGLPIAQGIANLRTGIELDADGRLLLDLRADVSDALLAEIEALGGNVRWKVPALGALRILLPLDRTEDLAAHPDVHAIHPADRAFTRKIDTSEGDGAHYADDARSSLGVDGSGVSVGVLSDGVDALASLVSSGDLPSGVVVLPGQAGSGNEGSAMLEIVHDLAPGASLLFATAFSGQASFANNIVALRNAGADIIVDDVGYFAEAALQDDDVAAAVDQVVADGALYFSAAGNGGNLDDGTAGVWEGDFAGSPFVYTLHWSDPLGGSGNDYDLFLTNKPGNVLFGASTDIQSGSGDPFEIIGAAPNDSGRQLIIVGKNGSEGRYLHLNANRGDLEHVTAGQTSGHPTARGAMGVAATTAQGKTSGFTGTEPVESYSSDGPRRIFFEANGTAITPGDFSSSGGELRQKPDLTAADCVSTASPGFSTFCGTSAAAPHAAAIAALLLERGGGPGVASPDDVRTALTSTALDIEAGGIDRNSGAGIAEALAAATAMPVPECLIDADCDDALFCNGPETCTAGACGPGTPPVCSGPTPFCDDSLAACTECLADAHCDDALFCNGDEICSGGTCDAGAPPVCSAPTPFCDDSLTSCTECLGDGDCPGGSCDAGVCVGPPQVPASSGAHLTWLALAVAGIAGLALRLDRRRRRAST